MADPIEKYLARVRFWLPRGKQQSIIAELRGVLGDRIDAATERNGRAPTLDEVASITRSFGPPVVVAARYVEGPSVISGMLAYFFWRVLWMALATTLLVQGVFALVELSTAAHTTDVVLHAVRRTFEAMLLCFACITGSFMIIERWGGRKGSVQHDEIGSVHDRV